ncbi:MAG: RHS repeat-associated core domain-containing protein, partial [Proteus mirabilis]|nr:RHS repeat-associated core domain-containing protein [Proteus mirabilis]MDU3489449.1 RHS repeat-associated core domain-containing protein [Proteus mirabilis]
AWGHLQRQTRPTSTFNREQNLRFQGQYFDKETGLHYNTFRYYAPDLGRFTQQDPIGLAGGINLYAYAPNPLTWVDPWGLLDENTFIHYTDKAGFDSIMKTGVLNPNSQGKVYVTDILMIPDDVTRNLLINNPKYVGRGDYAIIFKVDSVQLNNINKVSEFEYIHSGKLKMKEILHAGKNPYSIVSHIDYETRNKMTNNQLNARSKCGG